MVVARHQGKSDWQLELEAHMCLGSQASEVGLQPQLRGGYKLLALELHTAMVEQRESLVTLNKPPGLPMIGKQES